MRITSVELDNIKSYRHQIVPFHAGATAIRGHNGAGKSTLVEAIGYALFDSLAYDQQQFVREGEKYGTVTVGFVSALDDREYHSVRRCGSGASWYIYDPELRARVAEQKQDVTDFLRHHLRLESDTKLDDLFTDAIGVPQGTLTADFLLTPTNRKKKFDALLRVEEYRTASDQLKATRDYYREQRAQVQRRMDELERETSQLDTWRLQLAEQTDAASRLAQRLQAIEREVSAVEKRRDALRQAEAEVSRLAGALAAAHVAHDAATQRYHDAETLLREAEEATRIREETRADYAAYLTAQREQARVRQRQRERDELLAREATEKQQLAAATADLRNTRQRLRDAEEAERQIAALAPQVARQGQLEVERAQVENDCRRLEEARRMLARDERDAQALHQQIADHEARIVALEALRPEAELLDERRERVNRLNHDRGMRTEKERRLKVVRDELGKLAKERASAEVAVEKAATQVQKLYDVAEMVKELPALERQYDALEDRIRVLNVQIEQHNTSRKLSGGGNCPFLGEACINIRQRGENSLATYFDRLIAGCERDIAGVRSQQAELLPALEDLRTRNEYYAKLDGYESKLQDARERLDGVLRRQESIEAERAELEAWMGAATGQEDVTAAQMAFRQSDEADKQLRDLTRIQGELAASRERLDSLADECAGRRDEIAVLDRAPQALSRLDAELAALGDPKGRLAGLQPLAAQRGALETSAREHTQAVTALETTLTRIADSLAPFATVEDEERAVGRDLERTRPGYTRHLQYEQAAERFPATRQALDAARTERDEAQERLRAVTVAHQRASASFDAEELARVSRRADELNTERGEDTARLAHTQQLMAALTTEIIRVEALLADLEAARAEDATLDDLERMLQQFRDIIKEAGPSIMKALLRKISAEANRIFGEIIGDRSAQLSWESDYEIVLRRDGKERSFAQLSGGEQMSAALAVRLALLRSLTRLDIAFFDEPTQNMDGERRGNLAEQIRRVRGFEQLIVISHDDTFEQGLDNVVHLEKRNGETIFVEEGALVGV
ncbi:MAG TPA: SMC family ATPase [Ktedonobacterales bacterium]